MLSPTTFSYGKQLYQQLLRSTLGGTRYSEDSLRESCSTLLVLNWSLCTVTFPQPRPPAALAVSHNAVLLGQALQDHLGWLIFSVLVFTKVRHVDDMCTVMTQLDS